MPSKKTGRSVSGKQPGKGKPKKPKLVDESLQQVLSASGDVAYIWDLESDRITWLGDVTQLDDSLKEIKTGKEFGRLVVSGNVDRGEHISQSVNADGSDPYDFEYRLVGDSGDEYWVNDRGSVVIADDGKTHQVVGTLRSISDRKKLERELEHQAHLDALTGLYNENRIRNLLDQALNDAKDELREGAYILVGIDKLSIVNDVYGPEAAEKVIRGIAAMLEEQFDGIGAVGRINTDHFGIVLPHTDEAELEQKMEASLQCARDIDIVHEGENLHVTLSIGCVPFPRHSKSSSDTMIKAEAALKRAKRAGRNGFRFFSHVENHMELQKRYIKIADRIRACLQNGEIALALQPVVCPQTMKIKFYECLLRLTAEGQVVSACDFIETAEQLGLTKEIDAIVLEKALEILEAEPDIHLAINISALNADDGEWLQNLMSRVYNKPEIAKRLIIEITETAAIKNLEETARFVQVVRSIGCRVAMDDFGEGNTNIKNLRQLMVDIVKIDGSFIQGIVTNEGKRLYVEAFLKLAEQCNITLVAEWVEHEEEFSLLRDMGVHLMQGFFFGGGEILEPAEILDFFEPKISKLRPQIRRPRTRQGGRRLETNPKARPGPMGR